MLSLNFFLHSSFLCNSIIILLFFFEASYKLSFAFFKHFLISFHIQVFSTAWKFRLFPKSFGNLGFEILEKNMTYPLFGWVGGWVGILKVLGYGWAGLMRRFLVDPAHMWWPVNLVQVTIFRQVSQVFFFLSKKTKKSHQIPNNIHL